MASKPILFPGPFFSKDGENRMDKVGDTAWVRNDFEKNPSAKLKHLLSHRYSWMNDHLEAGWRGVEIGCGAGFSQYYLRDDVRCWRSDCMHEPWLSAAIDGLALPFGDKALDFVIAVDVIHHLAHPIYFFQEIQRVLKPGGRLILKDVHASFLFRAVLRLMRHEGYAYNVDPLGTETPCNDPADPWSGNNAVTDLLWQRRDEIEQRFGLRSVHHRLVESLTLYLYVGVTARKGSLDLGEQSLEKIQSIDDQLCSMLPEVFPTGMQWVLELQ